MASNDQPDSDLPEHRSRRVEQRIGNARDSLPGERNDLPDGTLGGVPTDPQGDENRQPPNTPTMPPR